MNPVEFCSRALRDFARDTRAVISAELVLVVPLLCWAFFGTMVFNDAYRARMHAQAAALNVADAISRKTDMLSIAYLEGMNDVYDFLIAGSQPSRLRITAVVWDRIEDRPMVLWSHGTRGLRPLPANTFELLGAQEFQTLRNLMDGEDGDELVEGFTQMPTLDLHNRIPPVMPGEALVLVEAFTMWQTPVNGLFLGFDMLENTRLSPIAVVRPRFTPFLNFQGAQGVEPPDAADFEGLPLSPTADPDGGGTNAGGDPNDPTDPDTSVDVANTDFSSGAPDGWSTTQTSTPATDGSGNTAIGTFLGPFGNETRNAPVTFTHTFSQTMSEAIYEFDLVLFDSWDHYDDRWAPPEGEAILLSVNGETVAFEVFAAGAWGPHGRERQRYVNTDAGQLNIRFTLVDGNLNYNGNGWRDQLWKVRLQVADPAQTMVIGFAANTSEPVNNEGFGIAAMTLTATPGAHDPNRYVPDAATSLGADSLTGFQTYDSCYSRSLPAPGLTLTNSDLWDGPIRMLRNVGGFQRLRDCPNNYGPGYIKGSASVKLDYENDTGNWDNNRLRIRTEDGADGRDCDATMLIRDPNGQWMFNDDLWGFGWNTGLELDHAPTGTYTIWFGGYAEGECETELVFEHY